MQVPIMLRSTYCSLADHSERELQELGECPYDQARLLQPVGPFSTTLSGFRPGPSPQILLDWL